MKVPPGFSFSGVHAGIKSNRRDLALVSADSACAAAGCFTQNRAKAAPVRDAERRLPSSDIRAVVINSGIANALTGPAGLEDVDTLAAELARALGVGREAVLSASTGVIGRRLPVHKLVAALPSLIDNLRPEPLGAAEAILTTDTRVKMAVRSLELGGREVTLSAICKGSGMIHPALATLIAVVVTDCAIDAKLLSVALGQAVAATFNCLTVDGDMSTNDSVFALANGRADNPAIVAPGPALDAFTAALTDLCRQLAKEVAADGEGATKFVEVNVHGAPNDEVARDLARAVAGSSLVKAAIFGGDPNWGRMLSTVGARAGSRGYDVDPNTACVRIQDVAVYHLGPLPHDEAQLKVRMRAPEIQIAVTLTGGTASGVAWGCDLSYDYVKLNADYSSVLVQTPDGGVGKDNRLSNYSSAFKTSLLVEALSYISRFNSKRCVIKYGGAAMVKESLKASFCQDINLLRSVGLFPIVVHGGGPEITRTLERLGSKPEFIDGFRVTNTADLKLVEMVLTGAINTGLVTLLNQEGSHAVGLSGKDGALLRARKHIAEHGRDLGQVGEVTKVNHELLELLLKQGYIPVISPVGLGEDGQSYNINADAVAAEVALAVAASKLIYLTDVAGILRDGELISELDTEELGRLLGDGTVTGGMKAKGRAILRAIEGGVERVHVIDGRLPHSVVGELFTDRGVGTLVTAR